MRARHRRDGHGRDVGGRRLGGIRSPFGTPDSATGSRPRTGRPNRSSVSTAASSRSSISSIDVDSPSLSHAKAASSISVMRTPSRVVKKRRRSPDPVATTIDSNAPSGSLEQR
ncbi:hypothetical protein [Agromyces mangrovi Wang et al. 2018]|uniref:hypothetical protein n=1 Tax=Agromyces mangrovi TaxID=1858653 RepID=UPI002573AE07|nr:hypothetical protein [Agromyces mangrovi]